MGGTGRAVGGRTEKLMQTFLRAPVMSPKHSLRNSDSTQEMSLQVNFYGNQTRGTFLSPHSSCQKRKGVLPPPWKTSIGKISFPGSFSAQQPRKVFTPSVHSCRGFFSRRVQALHSHCWVDTKRKYDSNINSVWANVGVLSFLHEFTFQFPEFRRPPTF